MMELRRCSAWTTASLLLALFVVLAMPTQGLSQDEGPRSLQRVNKNVGQISERMAYLLSDEAFRRFVFTEIRSSRNRELIVDLRQTLTKAHSLSKFEKAADELDRLTVLVNEATTGLGKLYGGEFAALDLYLPVPAHRKKWQGGTDLLVGVAPAGVADETTVRSLTVYRVGNMERETIPADKPPETPLLIIAPEEHLSHDVPAPLAELSEKSAAEQERGPGIKLEESGENSYIGIPKIKLLKKMEPFWKGKPEIYVLVGQANEGTAIEHSIELPSVNKKNKWYNLGDGPGEILYFYFDGDYSDETYFKFMERDSGSTITVSATIKGEKYGVPVTVGLEWSIKDGDDSLGARTENTDALDWGTYSKRSTGYVDYKVDKDK